jgi:DNA-binding NarL/FixJ family response regulator
MIFMDITLPDIDGRDAAVIIKDLKISPAAKMVCFSCHQIEYQKTEKYQLVFDHYMQKDSDINALKSLIDQTLLSTHLS